MRSWRWLFALLLAASLAGCSLVTGLGDFSVREPADAGAGPTTDVAAPPNDVSVGDGQTPDAALLPEEAAVSNDAMAGDATPDATRDATPDATRDAAGDAATDATLDVSADVVSDATLDAPSDATSDGMLDAPADAPPDATPAPDSGLCQDNARDCVGVTPRLCATGQWVPQAACSGDTPVCTGAGNCVCASGQKRCNVSDAPELCTGGVWQAQTACGGSTPVCQAGTCVAACTNGARDCTGNNNAPRLCTNGNWVTQTACSGTTPVCAAGLCVCSEGARDCLGNSPLLCSSQTWQPMTGCSGATPVCYGAGLCGCSNGTSSCANGTTRQLCVNNAWVAQATCPSTASLCSSGVCVSPSCDGLANTCGPQGNESCCATGDTIPGGMFNRSNNQSYPATVAPFILDRFEITVGRFRKFVVGFPGNMPAGGSGKNPNNASDPGWNATWSTDGSLTSTQAALLTGIQCNSAFQTWNAGNDNRPMNCMTWYEAYAFCIWDGGRLPTEAEWNFAAAGGSQQREYPWGATVPSSSLAIYGCFYNGSGPLNCSGVANVAPVGTDSPAGDGRWKQADLAGGVWEWMQDYWGGGANDYPSATCTNCVNLTPHSLRVVRGASFRSGTADGLRSTFRTANTPTDPIEVNGARCARTP